MVKRMLIDAAHPEETRVVVLQDRELLDFDFESAAKRQLKGNVYLAKIVRVEPALQAAFVEYGGARHGFLSFSEIHPDYYQIPAADRQMLEDLERETAAKAAAAEAEHDAALGAADDTAEVEGSEVAQVTIDADEETADVVDEYARRRAKLLRNYKIQEVVKRRQIMLVQVVKEERGSKGAALTTYLSLAGRYCVLMANTPRGGGISRKIASAADRRRLRDIATELEVPLGMGLIVRTAGAERTRPEIRRDYEYLIRLWDEIRETTLKSIAPALIYEEGDLIKRALRDLYSRDIDEVLIEGEAGFASARRLMQMLMPSRVKAIQPYRDEVPLFARHQVEAQLDKIYNAVVQLPSGGSIVIHTTEALTAVDVNSGRSTRERSIDETAVKTNLEAADEVARQLRLRDLAGLIVIDFIDMSENRHQRQVEKRLRDALKLDRARIQLGRISVFGLLELSRQRLRPSILELSTQICSHCQGAGVVRSPESCALLALRLVQEAGIRGETASLRVGVSLEVGLYLLNHKREQLLRLEQRYAMKVLVQVSDHLQTPPIDLELLERREARPLEPAPAPTTLPPPLEEFAEEIEEEEEPVELPAEPAPALVAKVPMAAARAAGERPAGEAGEEGQKKRRRRRRRRRRAGEPGAGVEGDAAMADGALLADEAGFEDEDEGEFGDEAGPGEPALPVLDESLVTAPEPLPMAEAAAAWDAAEAALAEAVLGPMRAPEFAIDRTPAEPAVAEPGSVPTADEPEAGPAEVAAKARRGRSRSRKPKVAPSAVFAAAEDDVAPSAVLAAAEDEVALLPAAAVAEPAEAAVPEPAGPPKPPAARRRRKPAAEAAVVPVALVPPEPELVAEVAAEAVPREPPAEAPVASVASEPAEVPLRRRRVRRTGPALAATEPPGDPVEPGGAETAGNGGPLSEVPPSPGEPATAAAPSIELEAPLPEVQAAAPAETAADDEPGEPQPPRPRRRGWWNAPA